MSVNSKMKAIADEIRELSGTTEAMGLDAMASHIEEANSEVSNQTDILAQVVTALEGKAAGGSSGGDTSVEDSLVTGTLTNYTNDRVTSIRNYAFASCSSLTAVSFPVATTIGDFAFRNCPSLATANFFVATTTGYYAFQYCYSLTTVSFPVATTIDRNAFADCSRLTTASFPAATNIYSSAFQKCYNLKSLYLLGSSVCTLSNSNAFTSTPIDGYSASAGTFGSIYVPQSLLTSYQTATNWTYFSSRFVGVTLS